MNKAGKILSISPKFAIPGGEILINCEGLQIEGADSFSCFINGEKAGIVGASSNRVLAIVPQKINTTEAEIYFENVDEESNSVILKVGKKLADNLHMVSNPAVDPKDDSIIVTRSGSRGQEMPVSLFRLESDGFLTEMPVNVLNPTGLAFDKLKRLFITNRADGEVLQLNSDKEVFPYASDLGVATGIAFDKSGMMYVGDRSGNVYRVSEFGDKEVWATLEPSVSAYHIAFGRDENLYVTAPGLCSYDSIYQIDIDGYDDTFYKGLGRPQGLAFDEDGNLYVAACLEGRHGIVRISEAGIKAELIVAGMSIVGLCFTRRGEMLVATNDSIYSIAANVFGILLD